MIDYFCRLLSTSWAGVMAGMERWDGPGGSGDVRCIGAGCIECITAAAV